jgi:hypothetical protein
LEAGVSAAEDGNEMVFEGSDGPLGCDATMEVRRHQLKIYLFGVEKLT